MEKAFSIVSLALSVWLSLCLSTKGSTCLNNSKQEKSLEQLRGEAIQKAAQRNEKHIVKLEIFSNDPKVPRVGTGVVVSSDGLLITSSFFFVDKDCRVIAKIGDQDLATRRIGTDHSRNLVLLKIDGVKNLPFQSSFSSDDLIGSTVIALGRTYSNDSLNLTSGIISAKKRIWGKAIQTDAKIGPANYGGPLVNLKGEMIGLITFFSTSGVETSFSPEEYDSGIGFAISSTELKKTIQRIQKEGDLFPGQLGLQFKDPNMLIGKPLVASCYPRSPAAKAGIRSGDMITHVNDIKIDTTRQFRLLVGPLYGNDKLNLRYSRGSAGKSVEVNLASQLALYRSPYLGIIPSWLPHEKGVAVSMVDKKGPSNQLLFPGDVITRCNQSSVKTPDQLDKVLANSEARQRIELKIIRQGKEKSIEFKLGSLQTTLDRDSFPNQQNPDRAQCQTKPFKMSGYENRCELFKPTDMAGQQINSDTLFVVLATGAKEKSGIEDSLKTAVERSNYFGLLLFPTNPSKWDDFEAEFIELSIRRVLEQNSSIRKLVLFGRDKTTDIALDLVVRNRVDFAGLVINKPTNKDERPLPLPIPGRRLFVYLVPSKSNPASGMILGQQLIRNGLPVAIGNSPINEGQPMPDQLIQWTKLIDRM